MLFDATSKIPTPQLMPLLFAPVYTLRLINRLCEYGQTD